MKKLITFAVAICCLTALAAQTKISVQFNEKNHDFGTVKEEDGRVSTVFKFVNTSAVPISIKNVRTSCGCTSPNWSKAPIAPQAEGSITVTYSAAGRPGSFAKSITVQLGTDQETITEALRITGKVTPRPKTPEETYPNEIGANLRAREKQIEFGSMIKGVNQERFWEIYNSDNATQTITFARVPAHITLNPTRVTLEPKKSAKITVTYNSGKGKSYGTLIETINVLKDGKTIGKLNTRATVKEDFSHMTDIERQKAPIAVLTPANVNFSTVKIGEKRTMQAELKNQGQTPLIIRNITTDNCNYVNVEAAKNSVRPGKSVKLTITIDTSHLKASKFNQYVHIITNDPLHSDIQMVIEFNTQQ